MPVPIFLILFNEAHGRDPRPDELTLDERRLLLESATESKRLGRSAQDVEHLRSVAGLQIR